MSRILKAVHETARGLRKAGTMELRTMREFDRRCVPPVKQLSPAGIKRLRRQHKLSQGVFAEHLGVGKTTVQQWEQGAKRPSGPSLKLLNILAKRGLDVLT